MLLLLLLVTGAQSSRLYSGLSPEEMKCFSEEPVTFNNHREAITVDTFHARPELSQFFNILSTNRDRQGVEFVSSMEGEGLGGGQGKVTGGLYGGCTGLRLPDWEN